MSVSRGLQDFLSSDCYVGILRTFRILFHRIVLLVSRALLGVSFIGLFRQYLTLCQDSSFIGLLRQHLTHFQVSHLMLLRSQDCYLVSRAFLGFSLVWLLLQLFAHFKTSLSLDCYVSISHTFRILLLWKGTSVFRQFPFIGLIRQCLVHLLDSHSFEGNVCLLSYFQQY